MDAESTHSWYMVIVKNFNGTLHRYTLTHTYILYGFSYLNYMLCLDSKVGILRIFAKESSEYWYSVKCARGCKSTFVHNARCSPLCICVCVDSQFDIVAGREKEIVKVRKLLLCNFLFHLVLPRRKFVAFMRNSSCGNSTSIYFSLSHTRLICFRNLIAGNCIWLFTFASIKML